MTKRHAKDVLTAMVPNGHSSELRNKFSYLVIKEETLSKCLKETKEL